jgi:hypothetical protein
MLLILSLVLATASPDLCLMPCKPQHKKVVKKVQPPKVEVVKEITKPCCEAAPQINVNVTVNNTNKSVQNNDQLQSQTQNQYIQRQLDEDFDLRPYFQIGVLGGIGFASCVNDPIGLLGVRAKLPRYHIGAQLSTEFYWGHAFQVLVYPISMEFISWHLNGGVGWFYHKALSVQNVPRSWDVLLGTGLEVRVLPFASLTGDVRFNIPNPGELSSLASSSHLNVANTVGNSFASPQFMLGLMIHTW